MQEESSKSNHLKWILPLLILLLAAAATLFIVKMRKPPAKVAQTERGVLVEVMELTSATAQARVDATGTVEPKQKISLVAEVSGILTWASPRFVEGGFFRKGDKLLEIDPRDYRLAVERAQADLARAETGLQTEEEQTKIARREWERLELQEKGSPSPLVLRQPQLKSEKANLAAAAAGLQQARLNLERTLIRAPFNARLSSKKVDQGEYIRSGNQLGTLAGTDRAEIVVPLPVEELRWLNIPEAGSDEMGSTCVIRAQLGDQEQTWNGRITRALGEVDSKSRMTRIAVEVIDPYALETTNASSPKLPNGLFVRLEISGSLLEHIVTIPRSALREDDSVWLAGSDGRLEIRPVHVLRRQGESLLIDTGLQTGDRLVLTSLSGAASGMQLRPRLKETPQ